MRYEVIEYTYEDHSWHYNYEIDEDTTQEEALRKARKHARYFLENSHDTYDYVTIRLIKDEEYISIKGNVNEETVRT